MNIKIDSKVVEEQINKSATSAVEQAFRTYEVTRVLQDQVADKVIGEALLKAINDAANKLDLSALTEVLAKEMSRSITAGVVHVLREHAVEMVYRMQGGTSYASNEEQRKTKIRAKMGV
jgi:hypothetical protein